MTAREAIDWVDGKKHNVYSQSDKLVWLNQLEQTAGRLYARFGQSAPEAPAADSILSIPAPYDQLYLRWLEAQIDYASQEYLSYNNAMAVFNTLWTEFANFYCRTHLTAGQNWKVML